MGKEKKLEAEQGTARTSALGQLDIARLLSLTASVRLDAPTAEKFEEALRNGLVGSGAIDYARNIPVQWKAVANTSVDAVSIARFSEVLRDSLFQSGAISQADKDALDRLTGSVK